MHERTEIFSWVKPTLKFDVKLNILFMILE